MGSKITRPVGFWKCYLISLPILCGGEFMSQLYQYGCCGDLLACARRALIAGILGALLFGFLGRIYSHGHTGHRLKTGAETCRKTDDLGIRKEEL